MPISFTRCLNMENPKPIISYSFEKSSHAVDVNPNATLDEV